MVSRLKKKFEKKLSENEGRPYCVFIYGAPGLLIALHTPRFAAWNTFYPAPSSVLFGENGKTRLFQ